MLTRAANRSLAHRALLAFLFGLLAAVEAAAADALTVRAAGFAEGHGLSARRRAADEAGRDAVGQYVNRLVARTNLVDLGAITGEAAAYIERLEVIRFDETDQGTRIEADVHLREDLIFQALARNAAFSADAPPSLILVLGEQLPMDTAPAVLPGGAAAGVLEKRLGEAGIAVSGVEGVDRSFSHPELVRIVLGDVETGGAFARAAGTDAAAVGLLRAGARPESAGSNVYLCEATLTLRFYRGFDGKMVETLSETQRVHSPDIDAGTRQAVLDVAARAAAPARVAAVVAVLSAPRSPDFRLTVEDPGTRERMDAVGRVLGGAVGVSGLREAAFEPGRGVYIFHYEGAMTYLADLFDGRNIGGGQANIIQFYGQDMHIAFESP